MSCDAKTDADFARRNSYQAVELLLHLRDMVGQIDGRLDAIETASADAIKVATDKFLDEARVRGILDRYHYEQLLDLAGIPRSPNVGLTSSDMALTDQDDFGEVVDADYKEEICLDGCEGCTCHIAPPCYHCVTHQTEEK